MNNIAHKGTLHAIGLNNHKGSFGFSVRGHGVIVPFLYGSKNPVVMSDGVASVFFDASPFLV
jgi:hypothetical protein